MRNIRLVVAALAGALALPLATGCSHNQAFGTLAPANAVTVHVNNQNFHDMDVFMVADGLATRLGTVDGNQAADFMLDPSVITPDLRIVATPIGGNGRASTGPLVVNMGQTIDFRIGTLLSNSTVFIR